MKRVWSLTARPNHTPLRCPGHSLKTCEPSGMRSTTKREVVNRHICHWPGPYLSRFKEEKYPPISFVPHQRSGVDGGVEAGHVRVLADARHHPHEELQLSARVGGEEEGTKLQGLDGHTLTLRLKKAYTHTHTHTHTHT